MTLTTSRGKTYEVEWIDGPTMTSGRVVMRMADSRSLAEIAAELDGLEWMKRADLQQGDKQWAKTKIDGMYRDGDAVTVSFELEG